MADHQRQKGVGGIGGCCRWTQRPTPDDKLAGALLIAEHRNWGNAKLQLHNWQFCITISIIVLNSAAGVETEDEEVGNLHANVSAQL